MSNFNIFFQFFEILKDLKKSYKALFIGIVGGYIGTLIGLPLPWLLGSLGLNLCFAFTKYDIIFPTKLLNPVFLIVGIILGGTLNVTLLYKIHLWIYSSVAMLICTLISTILAAYYFYKICKFEKLVSVLAALPGAFVPISAALLEFGKKNDYKGVLIPQATRVSPDDRTDFKKGASRIYEILKIKCQPVAINSGFVWPKFGMLKSNKDITVSILKPINPNLEAKEFLKLLQTNIYKELDNIN